MRKTVKQTRSRRQPGPVHRAATSPPAQSGSRCDPVPTPAEPWFRHPAASGFPSQARKCPEPPVDRRHRPRQAHGPGQPTMARRPRRTWPLRTRLRCSPRPGAPPGPPSRRPSASLCGADSWLVGVLLLEQPVPWPWRSPPTRTPFQRKVYGLPKRPRGISDSSAIHRRFIGVSAEERRYTELLFLK